MPANFKFEDSSDSQLRKMEASKTKSKLSLDNEDNKQSYQIKEKLIPDKNAEESSGINSGENYSSSSSSGVNQPKNKKDSLKEEEDSSSFSENSYREKEPDKKDVGGPIEQKGFPKMMDVAEHVIDGESIEINFDFVNNEGKENEKGKELEDV